MHSKDRVMSSSIIRFRASVTVLAVAVFTALAAAISPAPAATAAGPLAIGDTFAGYKNSFRLTTAANQQVEAGRITVPAGNYAISAKLYLSPPTDGLNAHVRCVLSAGGDFDQTMVNHDAVTAFTAIPLQVVHTFTASGPVVLTCGHQFTSGDTYLNYIKITAQQVNTLSNVPMP